MAVERTQALHSAVARFFLEFPVRWAMRTMGMRAGDVAIFMLLPLGVALFDGLMLAILIPVTHGLSSGSFAFIASWPGLRSLGLADSDVIDNFPVMFACVAGCAFLLALVRGAFRYALTLFTEKRFGEYSLRLVGSVFARFLQFGKAYFDRHNPGQLAAIINYHYQLLDLFRGLLRAATESLTLATYLAVMALISWRLTLVAMVLFPLFFALRRWITRHVRRPSEEAQATAHEISGHFYRVLTAAPHFQAHASERSALDAFRRVASRLSDSSYRTWKYRGLVAPLQEVSVLLMLLLILLLALQILGQSSKDVLAMFVFFFVARLALPRISTFSEIEGDFEAKLPSARMLFAIFDDIGKHIVPSGTRPFSGLRDAIEFRGLTFAYPGGAPVLRDVSFAARAGKLTALVGPSGAGKSTLTQLLLRFYDVAPGQLLLDGEDIRSFSTESLRSRIAFVSQDVALIEDSLRNNLVFGLDGGVSDDQLLRALQDACLQDLIDQLPNGLDTVLGDRGLTLSGGQRQRVAIARAMLRHASILILDEATSALDSVTERRVQDAIGRLVRDSTSLVVAHRLSTIQRADWVVVLAEGRVAEQGSFAELIERRGMFHALWTAQNFD